MTIRALGDLGYTVAPDNADAYSLQRRRLRGLEQSETTTGQTIAYGNDVFTGPYYKIFGDLKPGRANLRETTNDEFWNSLLSD